MNPATGRSATTLRSPGCSGAEAVAITASSVAGRDQVLPGQPAAVVHPVPGQVDAEPGEHRPDGTGTARERAGLALGQRHLPGQHLGALVVADLEHVLDDLRERGAAHRGDVLRVRRRPAPADGFPTTAIPRRRSASANTWAAAAAGSALRSAEPRRSRPSSTHSGEIGLTTSSGT